MNFNEAYHKMLFGKVMACQNFNGEYRIKTKVDYLGISIFGNELSRDTIFEYQDQDTNWIDEDNMLFNFDINMALSTDWYIVEDKVNEDN